MPEGTVYETPTRKPQRSLVTAATSKNSTASRPVAKPLSPTAAMTNLPDLPEQLPDLAFEATNVDVRVLRPTDRRDDDDELRKVSGAVERRIE